MGLESHLRSSTRETDIFYIQNPTFVGQIGLDIIITLALSRSPREVPPYRWSGRFAPFRLPLGLGPYQTLWALDLTKHSGPYPSFFLGLGLTKIHHQQ